MNRPPLKLWGAISISEFDATEFVNCGPVDFGRIL